jgi:hypothetical protein
MKPADSHGAHPCPRPSTALEHESEALATLSHAAAESAGPDQFTSRPVSRLILDRIASSSVKP